jgi:hypothetical protein
LEALHGSLEQKDKRTDAVKKYFWSWVNLFQSQPLIVYYF